MNSSESPEQKLDPFYAGWLERASANLPAVEAAWQELDPIFIIGVRRAGSSIVQMALASAGFISFGEGHLWLEIVECLQRFRQETYRPGTKRQVWTLGDGRNVLLEKYVALAIDRFHRDTLPQEPTRWLDKSPGPATVKLAPLLAGELTEEASQILRAAFSNHLAKVYIQDRIIIRVDFRLP